MRVIKSISGNLSFFVFSLSLAAFFFLCGCSGKSEKEGIQAADLTEVSETELQEEYIEIQTEVKREEETDSDSAQKLYVYVCGAVSVPGVYELDGGARVCDAVEAAGGFTGDACPESVNQARMITDGEQIRILTVEEAESGTAAVAQTGDGLSGENRKVNINTAGKEELMTLTGIGESKAESILEYRSEHGAFERPEDLMLVGGIKEGVFNKIKDDIII